MLQSLQIKMTQIATCCLCLSSDSKSRHTFITDSSIEDKILNYLSFRIFPRNDLPNSICIECLNRLNEFHAFAQKIHAVQKKMQDDFKILSKNTEVDSNTLPVKIQNSTEDTLTKSEAGYVRRTSSRFQRKGKREKSPNPSECDSNLSDNTQDDSDTENEIFAHNTIQQGKFNKKDFPTQLIKDCKLTISGQRLYKLLAKFFNLECHICTEAKTFISLPILLEHYAKIHKTKGYVLCCGQKLMRTKSMAMHMASHLQPEAFTCDICGKILTCPRILQYHKQNHLPEAERPLQCSEASCSRRFSYYSALLAHQNSHLPESKREAHICDECGKMFGTPNALSTHTSKIHRSKGAVDKYKYVCHICAHRFSNSGNLEYHLSTHEHRMSNQVQCTECGKWSKNKQCLAKHMVQHRAEPFSCEYCPYNCKTKQALHSHIETHHTKGKPHCCQTCGKTFKLKCTLKAHIAQHTGERKYQCTFCPRSFVNSGNFYAHRKRMHPKQLKEFYDERNRKEHEERLKILGMEKVDLNASENQLTNP